MAEIVTLKELEEKYGWGFVVLKNPIIPEGYAYITGGEYFYHSQDKKDCWEKMKDIHEEVAGVIAFGNNPKYENIYPSLSLLTVVNEPPTEYKK